MSGGGLATLSLVAEVSLVLAVFLLAGLGRSPSMRVRLIRAALLLALLAPITLTGALPHVRLLTLPAASAPAWTAAPAAGVRGLEPAAPRLSAPTPAAWLVLAWSAGALLVIGRWGVGLAGLNRAYRRGQAPPAEVQALLERLKQRLGVRGPVGLRISHEAVSGCVFGWLRPRVLLPAGSASRETLEAVLAHELCHIRARDPLWLALTALACGLYWFNPLVWACAGRHRHDIEETCDDAATEAVEPARYAAALVQAARQAAGLRLAAGAAMDRRGLAARVRRLLSRRTSPSSRRQGRAVVNLALAAAAGLVGAVQLVGPAPPVRTDQAAEENRLRALGFRPPRHKADERLIFFDASADVVIRAPDIGFMCDGIRCVTTVPAKARVRLSARTAAGGPIVWSGCRPEPLSGGCWVTATSSPVVVTARAGG